MGPCDYPCSRRPPPRCDLLTLRVTSSNTDRVKQFLWRCLSAAVLPICVASCSAPSRTTSSPPERHPASFPVPPFQAYYHLTWRGQRIGHAIERLHVLGADNALLEQIEYIQVTRENTVVTTTTTLHIEIDSQLTAQRVTHKYRAGSQVQRSNAKRSATGDWEVRIMATPKPRLVPGNAIPVQLLPFHIKATNFSPFHGPVLLPGRNFAVVEGSVSRKSQGTYTFRMHFTSKFGALETTLYLSPRDHKVQRISSGQEFGRIRVQKTDITQPFSPTEIVENASLPVRNGGPNNAATQVVSQFRLRNVRRPKPLSIPGQTISSSNNTWHVRLHPISAAKTAPVSTPPSPPNSLLTALVATLPLPVHTSYDKIIALVQQVPNLLEKDLHAVLTHPNTTMTIRRGDCTTHATLFVQLAHALAIPAFLVTGFRLDGDKFVRHRWAIARTRNRWLVVDPTWGEAPATSGLLGLAYHGWEPHDLAIVDDFVFVGMTDSFVDLPRQNVSKN